MNSLLVKQCR